MEIEVASREFLLGENARLEKENAELRADLEQVIAVTASVLILESLIEKALEIGRVNIGCRLKGNQKEMILVSATLTEKLMRKLGLTTSDTSASLGEISDFAIRLARRHGITVRTI